MQYGGDGESTRVHGDSMWTSVKQSLVLTSSNWYE